MESVNSKEMKSIEKIHKYISCNLLLNDSLVYLFSTTIISCSHYASNTPIMTESKSHKEKQYLKQYQYVLSIISVFDLPAGEILV